MGTVSLIGGHGTTIAWAHTFTGTFQIESALENGIAAATFGLVLASASCGPIAQFLIRRFQIPCGSTKPEDQTQTNSGNDEQNHFPGRRQIDMTSFLAALLAINI